MTYPNGYTGGDVTPIPLKAGALLYVKYSLGPSGIASQIWLQARPFTTGKPLTSVSDNCSQPALSPNGKTLAMVCTGGKQSARLVIASFDGKTLGPMRTLVASGLNAAPAWSPDGQGLAYVAPAGASGSPTATATPTARPAAVVARQVTTDVDLTPTTPLIWY